MFSLADRLLSVPRSSLRESRGFRRLRAVSCRRCWQLSWQRKLHAVCAWLLLSGRGPVRVHKLQGLAEKFPVKSDLMSSLIQPGSYSNAQGSSVCQECLPGTFQSLPGQSLCTNCSAGFATNAPAQSSCQACGAGSFSARSGLTSCSTCSAVHRVLRLLYPERFFWQGFYQDLSGQSSCQPCAPTFFSGQHSSSPTWT